MPEKHQFEYEASSPEELELPEFDDGFGPEGEFGLGRSWGYSIEPPLTFQDLVPAFSVEKRIWFFWMVVNSTYDMTPVMDQFLIIQAEINRTLARYDKYNGRRIVDHLETCSALMFLKHIKALMVDTGLPKTLNPDEYEAQEVIPPIGEDYGQTILCTEPQKSITCKRASGYRPPPSSPRVSEPCSDEQMAHSRALVRRTKAALPLEIYDLFCDSFLAKFFGPRRRLFEPASFRAPTQRLTSKAFLGAYQSYQYSFVADNIWVFDGEDFFENLDTVFGTLEDPGIRKAELVLSLRDPCFWCMARIHEDMTPIGQDLVLWGNELLEWDVLRIMDRYRLHCAMARRDIMNGWRSRFNILVRYPLEYLVLDMREAYSLDGHYIGVETASEFDNFKHGIPKTFIVRAPTADAEEQIRLAINTPYSDRPSSSSSNTGW